MYTVIVLLWSGEIAYRTESPDRDTAAAIAYGWARTTDSEGRYNYQVFLCERVKP